MCQNWTSGINFIHRLQYFLYLYSSLTEIFFFSSWLGMRVLVEVAWGLPDWLEFFRGKRCEWFRVFWSWSAKHWVARAVFSDRIAHFVLLRVNMIVKVCWFCLCCAAYFTEMQTRRAQVSARVLRLLWFSAFLSLGTLTPTCILRAETTRKPHINIADLLFLSAQGENRIQ